MLKSDHSFRGGVLFTLRFCGIYLDDKIVNTDSYRFLMDHFFFL